MKEFWEDVRVAFAGQAGWRWNEHYECFVWRPEWLLGGLAGAAWGPVARAIGWKWNPYRQRYCRPAWKPGEWEAAQKASAAGRVDV